ncbi:MAG: MBL fold metallo-hydrolase [Clostridia bacterium]|nr:MBL fold metallo-hydrolase [Clostridia bacterium]
MKIQFLGTGAADWKGVPPEFPGYRYFSSVLIDGVLLIDPGPEVFLSANRYGVDISKVEWIINTHTHGDHYNEETVKKLEAAGAEFVHFERNDQRLIGNYRITSVAANHSTCEDAKHFLIDDGSKKLYYALDGSWLMYNEYVLLQQGADMIVLDATIGDIKGDYRIFEHNNLNMVRELKYSLSQYINRFVISHMALTLHEPHEKLAEKMLLENIETAYDGLTLEI